MRATVAIPNAEGRTYVGVGAGAPLYEGEQDGRAVFTVGAGATHFSIGATAPLSASSARLTNGAFSLAQPVVVEPAKSVWTGPVSNDAFSIGFRQAIGANEPLRTGAYSATVTFTLSTTTP